MPAGANKNVAFIAVIAVMVPILIGLWFAAPMFLPMYMWTKVDLVRIAEKAGWSKTQIETKFKMKVRYHPRGEGDPLPWQIISMEPTWTSVHPQAEDEDQLLVRCTLISTNDGEPPGTTFINNTFKDRYFNVLALRLPPGSLGHNAKRPVVIYSRLDMQKMSITDADMTQRQVSGWENDDEWDERDDGWTSPGQP